MMCVMQDLMQQNRFVIKLEKQVVFLATKAASRGETLVKLFHGLDLLNYLRWPVGNVVAVWPCAPKIQKGISLSKSSHSAVLTVIWAVGSGKLWRDQGLPLLVV